MAKKLLSVWLSMTIVFFSSISIYAEDYVQGDFFIKNIVINGENIINYQLEDSFFSYKNSTYIPMTEEIGKIMGFQATMDWESHTLKLLKTDSMQKNISQQWMKNNKRDVPVEVNQDIQVIVYDPTPTLTTSEGGILSDATTTESAAVLTQNANLAAVIPPVAVAVDPNGTAEAANEIIATPILTAQQLDLKNLPVLVNDKVVYIPLSALSSTHVFGWDAYYEPYSGIYISTNADTQAKAYFNEPTSRYNKGLVNYIKKYNSTISVSAAQELVFLFQHEATINKVDQLLLMAIAHKESTFNVACKSKSGAMGLMQIMPATAALYGVTKAELLNAHTNIELGALYMKERIANYDGNLTLALSAYNQGSGAVRRGTYTTRYATKVMGAENNIKDYLKTNGYSTEVQ